MSTETHTGHRLFIDNDRESSGNVGFWRDLRPSKSVVAQGNSRYIKHRWDPRFANPLVAGSSPARPTSLRAPREMPCAQAESAARGRAGGTAARSVRV
jgi:hypothetical protein